ncbi:MAG TPA: ATP-binding protein [Armatimonadota bacterium]|jgi:serine/threonine-protein kinase RsbW
MVKPNEDQVLVTIPCHPRYLSVARLLVGGIGAQAGLSIDDVDDMKVAVSEAITNVMDHAYGGELTGSVVLRYRPAPGELTVEVEDTGAGFDPAKIPTHAPPAPGIEGGLGLYLVKELSDSFKVESAPGSGTKITITKKHHA